MTYVAKLELEYLRKFETLARARPGFSEPLWDVNAVFRATLKKRHIFQPIMIGCDACDDKPVDFLNADDVANLSRQDEIYRREEPALASKLPAQTVWPPIIHMESADNLDHLQLYPPLYVDYRTSDVGVVPAWPASADLRLTIPPCYEAEDYFTIPSGSKVCRSIPHLAAFGPVGTVVDAERESWWDSTYSFAILDKASVATMNDEEYLYVFLDVFGDTYDDDRIGAGVPSDKWILGFDTNFDDMLDAKDKFFSIANLESNEGITSRVVSGMSKARGKISITNRPVSGRVSTAMKRTRYSQTVHRVWEISIPLAAIGAKPGGRMRIAPCVTSDEPAFLACTPPDPFGSGSSIVEVTLSSSVAAN